MSQIDISNVELSDPTVDYQNALRIAQAKLLGWTIKPAPGYAAAYFCYTPDRTQVGYAFAAPHEAATFVPPIDDNSLRECRKLLSADNEQLHFTALLLKLPGNTLFRAIDASPIDQLRAILRVKGIEA